MPYSVASSSAAWFLNVTITRGTPLDLHSFARDTLSESFGEMNRAVSTSSRHIPV
jgi:hypothetical protein